MIALLLAAFAAPQLADPTASTRALAWEFSQWPESQRTLQTFEQAQAGRTNEALTAAARAWHGAAVLDLLLANVVAAAGNDSLAPSAVAELLRAAPFLDDTAVQAAQRLLAKPEYREEAQLALLRAGVLVSDPRVHPASLEVALQRGWIPDAGLLGQLMADSEYRARLWPVVVGLRLPLATVDALRQLDRSAWPAGDQLLAHIVFADSAYSDTSPAVQTNHALELWRGWMSVQLPTEQANRALQDAVSRHLIDCPPTDLEKVWNEVDPPQQELGLRLLAELAYPVGAGLLLDASLDASQTVDLRSRCVQALFRCGSDSDIAALVDLLDASTPAQLRRTLLGGFRVRRPDGLAPRLEALLPKLRTRSANLAIELLVLEGDDEQRLRWLNAMRSALPLSDQLRIVQAAAATRASEPLRDWCWEQASQYDDQAQVIGRTGLLEFVTNAELSGFYLDLLRDAPHAGARQVVLRSARELRSDSALQVLLEWLSSAEGRAHESSLEWAGLVIDEPAAEALFRSWWQQADQLDDSQLDLAAAHLLPILEEAREYAHRRFPEVELRVQILFLTRMEQGADADDFQFWHELLCRDQTHAALRRSAAFLLARALPESAPQVEQSWQYLESLSSAPSGEQLAHWTTFSRAVAGQLEADQRAQLRARLPLSPATSHPEIVRGAWQAAADRPLQSSLDAIRDRLFELLRSLLPAQANVPAPSLESISALHTELEYRLIAVRAHTPSAERDQLWAEMLLSHATSLNPDAIALLQKYSEANWPQLNASASRWLATVEGPDSWRRAPAPPDPAFGLPLVAEWRANRFFERVQLAYELGDLDVARSALQRVLERWPGDRRSHLWLGWTALEAGEFDRATAAFEDALAWSGWLPYALLEPRLGVALAEFLQNGSQDPLRDLIANYEQSLAILRGRTFAERMPKVWTNFLATERD